MGNFTEASVYTANVPKLETTDSVLGGLETAPSNAPLKALVDRTKYFFDRLNDAGITLSRVYTSGNLNTITASGFYYVGAAVTNQPGASGAGWLLVINNGSTLCAQFYTEGAADKVWFRRISSGPTFGTWRLLKIDDGTGDIETIEARLKNVIDGAGEAGVIVDGCVPFNINTGAGTFQISAGAALIDDSFVSVLAYTGNYPAYLKPDGTYTTVQPGSGTYITFDPYTSQYFADVQRRSMSYQGEIRMTARAADLDQFDGTGLGKWAMKGWALCNGANGTPDMRGRFIVGRHPSQADYDTLQETGGAASVTLSIANLPPTPTDTTISSAYYGLVKRSNAGQNVTSAATDTSGAGTEPNIVDTPLDFPYADAAGTAHENRPPYIVMAYMMRL